MINFLNRKKVLTTCSLEKKDSASKALADAGIEHVIKVVSLNSNMGDISKHPDADSEYKIYVYKTDSKKAKEIISK